MKKTSLLILAAVVMLFGACARKAEGPKKIVIASDCTWPPMEYLDADKNIIGFDIDLIAAVAKAAGFEYEIKNTAWDGIFAGLANGSYDAVISGVTITDERKKDMDFSEPYVQAGQIITVKVGSGFESKSTLADFVGKKVGVQIGTTGAFATAAVEGLVVKSYDEIGLAFQDLANGNLDAVVSDSPIAANFVLQNDSYKGVLKIIGQPFTDEWLGIAVAKGKPELLALINKGIEAAKKDGTVAGLETKWLR